MPNNVIYLALYQFINNLYANSLLATLNARESLREVPTSSTNILSQGVALSDF
ncbi:hypothetical protein SERLA73DRAFT_72873 [Serpula lacrymans var. lacrymans S7.3]|uniref:DUF6534 domain-containing protein n=2 Tax=Serpula lacrymans var. lacrymans TaxID=341189 RepID=F8PVC5_SERL3|nr:uncharacterized protein SERLADRAFT_437419 [Serpula lacrymans var. lacrymans S7.9]EGO00135.1 hypothetical protein SERLA73DRAFT_72873 [Serpula lacrymans var. lacrymans S7.3]EGO25697.1 hypothetical protein SERLADRAFT_437419 [Serpula lacrymans var. lacrymans S7.9]